MMKTMMKRMLLVLAVSILLVLPSLQAMGKQPAVDINLSVAASLKEAVIELENNFTTKNPGTHFQNNFGASGALAKQIENGAPADLFISANLQWMDYLKEKKIMDEKNISTFAFNTLVFIGKADLKINKLEDIVGLDRIAMGSPKSVPAGEYAEKALQAAGIDKKLENKLVMAKDVRACLMYAETGEVQGAFVYNTDAAMAKNVKVLFTVPQELYPRVTYPIGLTIEGGRKAKAATFYRYLHSAEAQKILARHGFILK